MIFNGIGKKKITDDGENNSRIIGNYMGLSYFSSMNCFTMQAFS